MEYMTSEIEPQPDPEVTCENCKATCCHLEAMLFDDADVPERFIAINSQGGMSMARLEDGLCAALDRKTMRCSIYEIRPWICREFEMGGDECIDVRDAFP